MAKKLITVPERVAELVREHGSYRAAGSEGGTVNELELLMGDAEAREYAAEQSPPDPDEVITDYRNVRGE